MNPYTLRRALHPRVPLWALLALFCAGWWAALTARRTYVSRAWEVVRASCEAAGGRLVDTGESGMECVDVGGRRVEHGESVEALFLWVL